MATLVTIPGAHALVRKLVVEDRSNRDVSDELRRWYPTMRGLSARSVRRFCEIYGIHSTSRVSDLELDTYVRNCVARVSDKLHDLRSDVFIQLWFKSFRLEHRMCGDRWLDFFRLKGFECQLRVGKSLQRVNPDHHQRRQTRAHWLTNPVSYCSEYFGEKLHIDQNKKLVMFGVTHVCAVDGHSGRIVGFATLPIKNNILIYESLFRWVVIGLHKWICKP